MPNTTDLLTNFTRGGVQTDEDSILVLRNESTVKLFTVDAQTKRYDALASQEPNEDGTITNVEIYLFADKDPRHSDDGFLDLHIPELDAPRGDFVDAHVISNDNNEEDKNVPTQFTFSFRNPENFGIWHIFVEKGRYSTLVGAIWQSGWDDAVE